MRGTSGHGRRWKTTHSAIPSRKAVCGSSPRVFVLFFFLFSACRNKTRGARNQRAGTTARRRPRQHADCIATRTKARKQVNQHIKIGSNNNHSKKNDSNNTEPSPFIVFFFGNIVSLGFICRGVSLSVFWEVKKLAAYNRQIQP